MGEVVNRSLEAEFSDIEDLCFTGDDIAIANQIDIDAIRTDGDIGWQPHIGLEQGVGEENKVLCRATVKTIADVNALDGVAVFPNI